MIASRRAKSSHPVAIDLFHNTGNKMIGIHASKSSRARSHIAMEDKSVVRRWTKHLKISRGELQGAVDKVGNSVAAVRKQIGAGK